MFNYKRMLERRIERLERKLFERKIGRGGVESNAYKIWQFLVDNGPSTSKQIKDFFPANKRDSIASMIVDCERMDCIFKRDGKFVANPDYEWDDVGVIRPTLADAEAAVDPDAELDIDDLPIDELADKINDSFSQTSASNIASLVVDRTTSNKIYYTVEFDDHDEIMHLVAKVSNGSILFTMPCVAYDDDDNEVTQLDWKGQDTLKLACNKLKTLKMIITVLAGALNKFNDQLDD